MNTPLSEALAHLKLLEAVQPTYAAILLFGMKPQQFLLPSEVKCLHFHGTEVRKPIPSYQIYKGTVFDLVDQAVDFVMSKITRTVGTRSQGPEAPVEYELPRDAVAEAIVNAVVHRLCKALHKRCYAKEIVMQSRLAQAAQRLLDGARPLCITYAAQMSTKCCF